MKNLLILDMFVCVIISASIGTPSNSLKVTLYYEALCPDCSDLIVNQLYPAYQAIGSSLNLDFVPYGNANREQSDGQWDVYCQHGPRECTLNKLEACGLSKATTQDSKMEFVNCVEMAAREEDEDLQPAYECANQIGLNSTALFLCVNSEEGDALIMRHAERTEALEPPPDFVPWVVFNDVNDQKAALDAFENFYMIACFLLDNKPSGCKNVIAYA